MACLHDHSCEEHDCSSDWSLYKHIDLPKVSALNEAVPGSVKSVFKAWEQRLNSTGEWDLVENFQGVLEYQTRYSKFQNVASITLHFPDSFGGDTTKIEYIGFKGEATQLKRDVVATIVYELRPNPSDHKTKAEGGGLSHVE
ncbi:hypothetical protein GBA52_028675 [Prunus armeniaca]|nr:hypothetical protein GBA52_028675 [Prunus armeniaca]